MEDTFRELTPEEIKLATIQFMGQHLTGEMKELNKNIIGESATLRSLSIDPLKVIQTIPGDKRPYATTVNAGINIAPNAIHHPIPVQQSQQPTVDPNQLEFDFGKSNLANSILDRLDSLSSKLDKVIALLKKD